MQSRCIYYENLYEEMKIILENANNKNQRKKYDLSIIKSKEIKCIEIVNYEKENLEYLITGSSSLVDMKQKQNKIIPELPVSLEEYKELLNEKFNIEYYGLSVNIIPYEISKILITLVASDNNISIFKFDYFTNYFTKDELLSFHKQKKEFSFDSITRDKSNEDLEDGDYHEIIYKNFIQETKDFNKFLRDVDDILKVKEGIEIKNVFVDEDFVKKTMIRYFVLSKKKKNVIKISKL